MDTCIVYYITFQFRYYSIELCFMCIHNVLICNRLIVTYIVDFIFKKSLAVIDFWFSFLLSSV